MMKKILIIVIWMPFYIVALYRGCSVYTIYSKFDTIVDGLENCEPTIIDTNRGKLAIIHGTPTGGYLAYGVEHMDPTPLLPAGSYIMVSCYNKEHHDIDRWAHQIVRDPATIKYLAPTLILPWVGSQILVFSSPEVKTWCQLLALAIRPFQKKG